jgi:hypothetical protein
MMNYGGADLFLLEHRRRLVELEAGAARRRLARQGRTLPPCVADEGARGARPRRLLRRAG